MLLKSLHLVNFLSYGEESLPIELGPLNVLIGTNGSGKSNLIEAIDILRTASSELPASIDQGGGVRHWLWKRAQGKPNAVVNAVVDYPAGRMPLRYYLSFTDEDGAFHIVDERIENEKPFAEFKDQPYFYYRFQNGSAVVNALTLDAAENQNGGVQTYGVREQSRKRRLQHEEIDSGMSILRQYKEPKQCPEMGYLYRLFGKIKIYRDWQFGQGNPARRPHKADLPNEHLEVDASNLGMVLNRMQGDSIVKERMMEALNALMPGVQGVHLQIAEAAIQVYLDEGRQTVPATRLSDSTLRFLALLAVLCDSDPGPLVCIDQPELGLHPDVLPQLGELLKDAATRTQLIIATHSDLLLDAFTDMPEAVLVCERSDEGTQLRRLDPAAIAEGLTQYKLGQLWMNGDLGGVRA